MALRGLTVARPSSPSRRNLPPPPPPHSTGPSVTGFSHHKALGARPRQHLGGNVLTFQAGRHPNARTCHVPPAPSPARGRLPVHPTPRLLRITPLGTRVRRHLFKSLLSVFGGYPPRRGTVGPHGKSVCNFGGPATLFFTVAHLTFPPFTPCACLPRRSSPVA